jgi:DNA-directed RNA polymerase alpha subunit
MTPFFISCKESRIEHNRSFYGSFSLGPFEGGQSLTIANALRRTLLSSLKGLAIISIQIEGVLHEYSSLPGVKDSVLDILLNLKEIQFNSKLPTRNLGPLGPQIGYLRARGPGIIRASDLKLPPFIKLVDPEQYIATLAEDGFINMKFVISEGQNYILQKPSLRQTSSGSKGIDLGDKSAVLAANKPISRGQNLSNSKGMRLRRFVLRKMKEIYGKSFNKNLNLNSKTNIIPQGAWMSSERDRVKKSFSDLSNSTSLTLDSVFAPVTKVNYIIESSEHKTIDTSFFYEKESNQQLQLLNFLKPLMSVNALNLQDTALDISNSIGKQPDNHDLVVAKVKSVSYKDSTRLINRLPWKGENFLSRSAGFTPHKNDILINNQKKLKTSLNEILYLKNKLSSINVSKEYVQPSSIKNNVIIEIWTNGSLHPREALYQALKTLTQVFSNLYNVPSNMNI